MSLRSTSDTGSAPFPWLLVSGGIVLYLLVQALFVGIPGIAGSSEAREAQVVDVIVREGTWALPLRNGIVPSKPPLYHWGAAALSLSLGGVSEFTARYTSQLCAAVCLLLVSLVTYRFTQQRRLSESAQHPRRAAILAAAILSLTYGFYQMGCQAMVDMTFAACVWGALASVALSTRPAADSNQQVSELGRTMFWLLCGLGVLARGPLGIVLPVALVGMAGWCTLGLVRTVRGFLRPSFGWLACVIPVTWYYRAYLVGGDAFLERQLFFENIKRFSGGEFVNSQPWWFYIPSVFRTTLPWGIVLLGIFVSTFFHRQTLSYPSGPARSRWLPLILLCTGMVLFSLSAGKRHSYLLPLLPLIAVQLGAEISSLFEAGGDRARTRARRVGRTSEVLLAAVAMFLLAGIGVFGELFVPSAGYVRDAYMALPAVISRSGVLVMLCAIGAFVGLRRHLVALYGSVWCLMIVVMTSAVAAGASIKAYLKSYDQMAIAWLATASEQDTLAVFKHPFDEYFDPILYYVHRPVEILPLEAVASECKPAKVYAAKREWLDAHQRVFRGTIVRVLTVRERLLSHKGDPSRDVVFFRCGTFGGSPERFESLPLHDASESLSNSVGLTGRVAPFQM